MKEYDSGSIQSGVIILDSLISYLYLDELKTLKSLIAKDDFIVRLVNSKARIDVKNNIFAKLLVGQDKLNQDIVYKIVESYANVEPKYLPSEEELSLVWSTLSKFMLGPTVSFDFLTKLKFMVFESKRVDTLGVDFTRRIFEVQKMKKCTLKFSAHTPEQ